VEYVLHTGHDCFTDLGRANVAFDYLEFSVYIAESVAGARREVVNNSYAVPLHKKLANEVAANEPGATSD
jgi:hypothetical protein